MKICPICQQRYIDENLNFCLNDGGMLSLAKDDAPPTVIMDNPRRTNPNWDNYQTPNYQNQQISPHQPFGMQAPPSIIHGQNQTLPTVSLIFGILGLLIFCCGGGIPFGLVAVITGYLGFSNANSNPLQYGGKGLAIAGMVIGAIGFFISLIFLIIGNIPK